MSKRPQMNDDLRFNFGDQEVRLMFDSTASKQHALCSLVLMYHSGLSINACSSSWHLFTWHLFTVHFVTLLRHGRYHRLFSSKRIARILAGLAIDPPHPPTQIEPAYASFQDIKTLLDSIKYFWGQIFQHE